jgi:hypothetical protein
MKHSESDGMAYGRNREMARKRSLDWYYANKAQPQKNVLRCNSFTDIPTDMAAQSQRGRGRPKVGDCRIETVVPQRVMELLIQREQEGAGYRTRIAANILCEWASKQTGKKIRPFAH